MRRSFQTLATCLTLLFLLLATIAPAADSPKLLVGGDHENPPYEFIKDGRPTGFNVELMRAVADAVGADVEFRPGPWSQVRNELEQGEIDALAGMYYSEERSQLVDFSVPHTLVTAGLFVRRDSHIRTIDDMKGKEVIVQKGDVIDDYLRKKGIASRLVEVKDPADVLRLLASGRHDCALMPSRFQGEYLVRSLGISNVRVISADLPQLSYCFAVKKGNTPLKYRLDEGLNILKVNGKYKEIYDKWFGVYEKQLLWVTLRYFVWALAIVAALLAASSIWSWVLRREVRKRTAALRDSEGHLRTLIHTLPDLVWLKDKNGVFLSCNSMFERLYNAPEADIVGKTDYDFVDRELADFFIMNDRKATAAGKPTINEEWLTFADDGHRALVETIKTPVYDDAGGLIGVLGIGRDITQRKQAEEELRESEEKFRVLAETSPAAICVYQGEHIVYCNASMTRLTGYTEQALKEMRFWEWMHEDYREQARERGLARQRGERAVSQYEIKFLTKEGEEKWLLLSAGRIEYKGEPAGIVTMFDITDRKCMEDELRAARDELEMRVVERTAELAENVQALQLSQFCIDRAGIGIYQSDETGAIFNVNEHACKSLGYSREELCALSVFDIDPEISREKMLELKEILDEKSTTTFLTTHRRVDGTTFPVEITANHLDFHGKRFGISFVKDITRRIQAEESLRRAKDEWERTFASVPDLIAILDDQYRIVRVNEAMAKRLGVKPEECEGLHCYEAIHGLSNPPAFCPHTQTMKDGRKHIVEVHEERLGGDFLVSTTPLNDERGKMIGSVHITYDITEQKRAEEALKESEARVRRKLDSILDPEGDIGELELADIIDLPQIKALMEDLYRSSGLKMSILDPKGEFLLIDVGWQEICRKYHRGHPETRERCRESDTEQTVGIPPGEFRKYKCKNNMWHLATPIIVGGRHMGNLFMSQFFFENEKIDYDLFRAQARKYGFPEEEYMAALEAVPRYSEEFVDMGKAVFLRLIDMFSKLSYANIKLARSLTERDRLTETLRESEALLKLAMDLAKMGAWEYDAGTGLFSFDDQFYALYGTTAEREGGTLMPAEVYARKFIPPEESAVVADGIEQARTKSHFQAEHRIIRADGEERFILVRGEAVFDQEGRFVKIRGANQDITERKLAEEAILESRAKYQAIVDNFEGYIYICSQDYRVEFMNRKLIERTGYDATGEFCYKVMHDRDSICPWCMNERVFKGETIQWEMFSPKDNRWFYVVNVPLPHADGTVSKQSMMLDITARKLAEEELRKANMVVESSPVVLFRCKAAPGWPVELVSRNVVQFGYTPEEFLSGEISYSSIVYSRDLPQLTAETAEYSLAGKGHWFQEYRIVTKAGEIRWIIDE
ncbi:MAG TPA: PAS domain S-box protein, partial [Geobacteraceae bacterium]|nr:PAS domain S-box protein [Geobacteraceae bacterium]